MRIYTLAVTTTPRAWEGNNLVTSTTKFVKSALGLHPQLVAQHHHEIGLWESLLDQTRYVGEVGLDGGPGYISSMDLQQRVFSRILAACERVGGKILTVHSVRAVSKVLDLVEQLTTPNRTKVILHWFTGSKAELRRAIDLGAYFSINPRMLDNERSRILVSEIPLDRVLTETDGPFAMIDGRPMRPSDAHLAVDRLAALHRIAKDQMVQKVLTNLRDIVLP